MSRERAEGFTLVELLIVVAIIAILTAIAIPQFAKYRERAVISAVEADLQRCISVLVAAYTDSAQTSTNCTVGETSVTVSIDSNENVTISPSSVTVRGQTVNCTVTKENPSSYRVSCS